MNEAGPDGFYHRLAESVSARYRSHTGKTLWDVYQRNPDFLNLEADLPFLTANRAEILGTLASPALADRLLRLFVDSAVAFTYANNQFIHFNAREERELERIYRQYLAGLQSILGGPESGPALEEHLKALVAHHFADLRTNIARFFDPEAFQNVQANVILNRAVCENYTPTLQLALLGIGLEDKAQRELEQPVFNLAQPVLDLGCGKPARLVTYLRDHGIEAVGVDRLVDYAPYLIRSDWLSFELPPRAWGTIISHMAFSNHFIFQHLYKYGLGADYACRYMAILNALKPGGSFYYTPGLPFIETYLPTDQYTVTKREVKGTGQSGEEGLYAVRVKRIEAG